MGIEIAKQLAEFVVKTKYEDLPQEEIDFTKALCLKTVAGMLAGSLTPGSRKMVRFLRERGGLPEVGLTACGFKASLWNAVMASAFFSHSIELEDDSFFNGGVCWDITVLPITFALAEKGRLSGKDLIEASAIGLEVHARTCLFPPGRVGSMCVIPGAVGPAAGAAKALGLSVEETMSAFGLALSSPFIFLPQTGTDAHFLESTLQSLQGLMAAEFAKQGLTGNPLIITYLSGLLGEENVSPEKITEDLGSRDKRWVFREIWVKKYPCCFFMHRSIDTILELVREHNLSYEQVDTIENHSPPNEEICNRPDPKTIGDLQFSFQHTLSCALLDKDISLDHFSNEIIADPKYKEARTKVKYVSHPEWPTGFMEVPARVVVKLKDGEELTRERMDVIGSLKEPLTKDQLKELYFKFTKGILSEEQIEWTANAILNLEKLNDVEELMDVLTFRHKISVR